MKNDPKEKAITIIAYRYDCRKLVDVHEIHLIGPLQSQGLGYSPAAEKESLMSGTTARLTCNKWDFCSNAIAHHLWRIMSNSKTQ